jgi:hypothetical protein
MSPRFSIVSIVATALGALAAPALAIPLPWGVDGVRVTTVESPQQEPVVAPDGVGGVFIAWADTRLGYLAGPYVQHLNPGGVPARDWPAGGVLLEGASYYWRNLSIAPDDAGGAWIAWDPGMGWVALGHVRGDLSLGPSAIELRDLGSSAAPGPVRGGASPEEPTKRPTDRCPVVAADGQGGALVAWIHDTFYAGVYPKVARFDRNQQLVWATELGSKWGYARSPTICPDGNGGAVVAWVQGTQTTGWDIAAVHISGTGAPAEGWSVAGNSICAAPGHQDAPNLVPDQAGGAVIAWQDGRGQYQEPFVQHVTSDGNALWGPDGSALCQYPTRNGATVYSGADSICSASVASDGAGGIYVVWTDYRKALGFGSGDIYAQHIEANGSLSSGWPAGGLAVCAADGEQRLAKVAGDGSGGLYVAWQDFRDDNEGHVFAQHIDGSGRPGPSWEANGVRLCRTPGHRYAPVIAADKTGGAVVAWEDARGGSPRIYATRIGADVAVPVLASLASVVAEPGRVRLVWRLAERDFEATVYRSGADGAWSLRGRVFPDGEGQVVFEDLEVQAGERYHYRLGLVVAGREEYLGETSVVIPQALGLAIEGTRPNPTRDAWWVSFTLPDGSPATLDLIDIAGRSVLRREVGSLGPGQHLVTLDAGEQVPPGLYLLRLTQGVRSVVRRASLLR